VARLPLLERLLDDIRRENERTAPQHHLLIGQRGTGKTTLLCRLAYAIADDPSLAPNWQPVTFPEEQYNVTDLTSFWINCVDALGDLLESQGDQAAANSLDAALVRMPTDPALRREASLSLLTQTSARMGKRLLLLVDNIDLILERIGADQEWEFRRVLQEQKGLLIIGASSRALEQAYEPKGAFYDFFRIHELSGLSEDETLAVLRTLAQQHGIDRLVRQLDENPSRVRAMRLLSGGNPRTIVLLFKILAQSPDGEVENDLQQLLDQYTPLYKERFEDLPQQAQILVDAIAANWDPITAGELAARVQLPVNAPRKRVFLARPSDAAIASNAARWRLVQCPCFEGGLRQRMPPGQRGATPNYGTISTAECSSDQTPGRIAPILCEPLLDGDSDHT
jgi:hypothetical protein